MSIEGIVVGNVVKIIARFVDEELEPADPTEVTVLITPPTGDEIEGDISNPEVGTYRTDVELTEQGDWKWRFEGTGAIDAAAEGVVAVRSAYLTT